MTAPGRSDRIKKATRDIGYDNTPAAGGIRSRWRVSHAVGRSDAG